MMRLNILSAVLGLAVSACDLGNPNIFITVTRPDQNGVLTLQPCTLEGGVVSTCNDPVTIFDSNTNSGALTDTVGIYLRDSNGNPPPSHVELRLAQNTSALSNHCDTLDIISLAKHLTKINLRLSNKDCIPIDFQANDCGSATCSFHSNGCGSCAQQ